MNSKLIKSLSEYSTRDLQEEISRRYDVENTEKLRKLCLNKITTKDFVVRIDDSQHNEEVIYSFYIRHHDGEEYCIYYGYDEQAWWPTLKGYNAAESFVPREFYSSMENVYHTDLSQEDAIKLLMDLGFYVSKLTY